MDAENNVASREDVVTVSEKTLGTLLEQDHFLFEVLACVMEDGLHECRLVCRRWRDVCRQLPVAIQPGIAFDASKVMKMATERFPNATALRLGEWRRRKDALDTGSMRLLPRLGNLRTLQMRFEGERPAAEALRSTLLSMRLLRSLAFSVSRRSDFAAWISILQSLTKLTSLDLRAPRIIRARLGPITELQGLLNLTGDFHLLVTSGDRLLFPSLTRLTALKVYWIQTCQNIGKGVQLRVITPLQCQFLWDPLCCVDVLAVRCPIEIIGSPKTFYRPSVPRLAVVEDVFETGDPHTVPF